MRTPAWQRRRDPQEWHPVELPGRGTTNACVRDGPGRRAPVVVLLHGWTTTGALNWGMTISRLERRYRVVALDHRGHGRGLRSPAPFTLEDCADDAVALLDLLGVGPAVFVGYSMGGPIAELAWRRHPERVAGLVLAATAADFRPAAEHRPMLAILDGLRRSAQLVPAPLRRLVMRQALRGMLVDRHMRAKVLEAMASHDDRMVAQAGREIRRFGATPWIGGIDVPVSVIVTTDDRLVLPSRQHQLAAAVPHAAVVELAAAHLVPFTRPKRFAAAIRRGCASVAPTGWRAMWRRLTSALSGDEGTPRRRAVG